VPDEEPRPPLLLLERFSDAFGLRPVRPRDSIIPAALPRCFVGRGLRVVRAI
jgi:hypothetical protein